MTESIHCTPEAIRWLQENLLAMEEYVHDAESAQLTNPTVLHVWSMHSMLEGMQASTDQKGAKLNIPKAVIPQYFTIWNIHRIRLGLCKTFPPYCFVNSHLKSVPYFYFDSPSPPLGWNHYFHQLPTKAYYECFKFDCSQQ